MLLAADKINADGGINGKTFKIMFEDNNSTSKGSVSAIRKLITVDKLSVIFGPAASSNFLAVCPPPDQSKGDQTDLSADPGAALSLRHGQPGRSCPQPGRGKNTAPVFQACSWSKPRNRKTWPRPLRSWKPLN